MRASINGDFQNSVSGRYGAGILQFDGILTGFEYRERGLADEQCHRDVGRVAAVRRCLLIDLVCHYGTVRSIDFASAYTGKEYERLEFSQEVLDEREAHWAEIFEDRWPVVQSLRAAFMRETGLILLDLSLNNIKFAEG